METNKSIDRSDVQKDLYKALVKSYNSDKDIISSYGDVVTLKRGRDDQDKNEDPSAGSNRGSKRRRSCKEAESSKEPTHKESKSTSSSKGASRSQPKSSGKSAHAEEHGQKVDDLQDQPHQEFNTGNNDETPVREALDDDEMELEYHLEEVFKATNDHLDWHNPERKPYPHDLSKPLPLIQNERGRQVIPWDYFINNDLEYLKGGSSSQKYTTSVTKTKAADYGQVKWIEDKGPKSQKFYGYATNMESSKDIYSRHRIIVVTSLKIMQFFCYSHLEEIIVRRQDDQLYKFREGDFKRLRRQDIKDMLLLLVQDKLTNLNLEERNRLMRTDEFHKFSDGTLNHVRTAFNDIDRGIDMDYLPKRKWSKQDKQRARVMIKAIDRKLRDRRLMRNLEKFVGGRPYGETYGC
ncbi:hypothetical protein Tco_0752206 [Tanacetum coccineum]|uniref:Uncharacterized protein n=1 Tax=Tanacetum coccineum TaxID=301880 RepID=A0ABQ4Z6B7_9ASTR